METLSNQRELVIVVVVYYFILFIFLNFLKNAPHCMMVSQASKQRYI